MAPTSVVTCFLRNRDDVLLVRRSDAVGSSRGRWGGVSGHVLRRDGTERDPLAAARAEIDEETGLLDACTLVREGDPFTIDEPDADRTWTVHPFLFDCDSRDVRANEESAAVEWVAPTAILHRETVPALWTSYSHVRPTVDTVAGDATHGSAYISLRALDVLRDRASELAVRRSTVGDRDPGSASSDWATLADLGERLLDARPSMAALRNRVARAMYDAADRTAAAVQESAQATIEAALAADEDAATEAAALVAGNGVLTLSKSGTVGAALERGRPATVTVLESAPGREGVSVAESLATDGVDVTLAPDAAVAHVLATTEFDVVLVGADTVLADGRVVNKVGTHTAAVAANRFDVPVYVVAATAKIAPGTDVHLTDADPALVYDGDVDLTVDAPLFDVTPADLVAAVVTETGVLDATEIESVARDHRERGAWRDR